MPAATLITGQTVSVGATRRAAPFLGRQGGTEGGARPGRQSASTKQGAGGRGRAWLPDMGRGGGAGLGAGRRGTVSQPHARECGSAPLASSSLKLGDRV